MVSFSQVLAHNEALKGQPAGFTAVLVGATRGIGLATLRSMTTRLKAPRLYVVGRSEKQFSGTLAELQATNPDACIKFIEADVSLVRNADVVAAEVGRHESHLDLLYMSPGAMAFGGPHYTDEGLDTCFVLSHYTRFRLITQLLPLLNSAPRPRVLSVLSGGRERALFTEEGDLGLALGNARNYRDSRVPGQVSTLQTLTLTHLASQNPHVSFLHIYPGWVATDFVSNMLSTAGIAGTLLKCFFVPIFRVIATDEAHSGERQLFHAFSGRYPSGDLFRSGEYDTNDVAAPHGAYSGFYRVLSDGETVNGGAFLKSLEAEGWPKKAAEYTERIVSDAMEANVKSE